MDSRSVVRLGIACSVFLLLALTSQAQVTTQKVFTLDSQFDLGNIVNLNHNIPNQLQVNPPEATRTFPFITVAASGRGTLIRIRTEDGVIVGEYWSAPQNMAHNPSRTTVDLSGNVWAGNRDEGGYLGAGQGGFSTAGYRGSALKIGLIVGGTRVNADGTPNPAGEYLQPPFSYNTCQDRNNDGLIHTSRGLGNILGWPNGTGADTAGGVSTAADECILVFARISGPNVRHVSVDSDNNVYVGGYPYDVRSWDKRRPDGSLIYSFTPPCGGYGGFIDSHGVLWSAGLSQGNLLHFQTDSTTSPPTFSAANCIGTGQSYGLGADSNGYVWNSQWQNNNIRKFSPDGVLQPGFPKYAGYWERGVAATSVDNHIWVANSYNDCNGNGKVTRLDNAGNVVKQICVGATPTGVAVDSNGKVWVTNYDSSTVMRIDPNAGPDGLGAVDLTVNLGGGANPYNYSDMTGTVVLGTTTPQGSFTVIHDSGLLNKPWGAITWNTEPQGFVPPGALLKVEACAANTSVSCSPFVELISGAQFNTTGQYLHVRATLRSNPDNVSPVLSDLTINNRRCYIDSDGDIDRNDISLILAARNTVAAPGDPRDANGNGVIDVVDSRLCSTMCTRLYCAQ